MNPKTDILQKIVEYENHPTESKMWEIWLYCDKYDMELPRIVRDRLRKVAKGKVKDNQQADLKMSTRRFIRFLFGEYTSKGMSASKAAELIAEQDITVNGQSIYSDEPIDPRSILRDYQRSIKK